MASKKKPQKQLCKIYEPGSCAFKGPTLGGVQSMGRIRPVAEQQGSFSTRAEKANLEE